MRPLRFVAPPRTISRRFRLQQGLEREAGVFRVVYVARFKNAVYVLHAFQKKSQKTAHRDIELARERYGDAKDMDEE